MARDDDRSDSFPSGGGDDLPEADVVIPDDPRELDADRLAYLYELRDRARAEPRPRMSFLPQLQRYGLSGPLLTLALVGVGLLGILSVTLAPRLTPLPQRLPLTAATTAPPGRVGGLLPDSDLVVGSQQRPARALRPAVVALLTPRCDCAAAIESVFSQAAEYRIRIWLVGPKATSEELRRLAMTTGNGTLVAALDESDAFGRAYDPRGLTVLIVRGDGLVDAVVRDVGPGHRLDTYLARLRMFVPAT